MINNESLVISQLFSELLTRDKLFQYEFSKLKKSAEFNPAVFDVLQNFLTAYSTFHKMNSDDVANSYSSFLKGYSEDLIAFKKTGKYPVQLNTVKEVSRIDYDIALILSTMLSRIRFAMMAKLFDIFSEDTGKTALIGIGAGVDLEVILHAGKKSMAFEAYDIEFSHFVASYFKDSRIIEKEFVGTDQTYSTIVAVELLEHLTDPFSFTKMVSGSLKTGGIFVFTTATDMPQFDHLYNFSDDMEVADTLQKQGFKILEKSDMLHNYFGGPKTSKNSWYVAEKV